MKIITCLLLLSACSLRDPNSLMLKDFAAGEDLSLCSPKDENDDRKIFPSLKGECDYIKRPSPFHKVTRQVINGEVCCVMEVYIDHGNGIVTSVATERQNMLIP